MAEITRKELILVLAAVPHTACPRTDHLVRLAGVDLSGLDLRGLNLAHADLAGADLRGCDLSDARLAESDLSGADLTDAILCGVWAEGTEWSDARLVRADFRKSRRDLFYGTHLSGADFQGADLTDARLAGAHLWGARFNDANLTRADLRGAQMNEQTALAGAIVEGVLLDEVDWAEAAAPEIPAAETPCELELQILAGKPGAIAPPDRSRRSGHMESGRQASVASLRVPGVACRAA